MLVTVSVLDKEDRGMDIQEFTIVLSQNMQRKSPDTHREEQNRRDLLLSLLEK